MEEPTPDQVAALAGPTLLEFGASWCGHCHAAEPLVRELLAAHPELRHIRIEDGRGKRLGRAFRVKLWPTFVYLVDGQERGRAVRPRELAVLEDLFAGPSLSPVL